MRTLRCFRFIGLFASLLILAACGQQEQAPTTAQAEQVPTGRLPKDVVPQAYTLQFTMNPDDPGFSGHVEIKLELTQPRDVIWLHGQDLRVSSTQLVLADGSALTAGYEQVNDDGVVKISLPETVEPQEATLVFDYSTDYYRGLEGAYKVQEDGENYIFTQFEAIAARRAFPSFDEPAFKTPYTVSFTVPAADKVVTNTLETGKTDAGNGMVTWQFPTTKPLPTYLIAWAVGPLDIVEAAPIPANEVRDHPVPLAGVAVKGKGPQLAYALENAGTILSALENYFGVAYPYPKLALIAVPDFGAGAMENPGAVTFREILLLMDPKTAPEWQTRAYWSVTAHELAHQWFGDLVTMPWWDDIWLNEAFATWTAQKMMETLHPEWEAKARAIDSMQRAMRSDSLATARQIRQPIESTADIENAFDGITYSKGGAVIAMFENYLGEEIFRQGVHEHLQRFAYGNADVHDFLASISKAAGHDIGTAFKTFLNQPGLPYLEVALDCTHTDAPVLHISQSRYLPLGSKGDTDKQWQLPACVSYPSGESTASQCQLITEKAATLKLNSASCPAWVMPNAGGNGYYQWVPADGDYAALTGALDGLSQVEQKALAGSISAAFNAGTIDTAQALQALEPLAHSEYQQVITEPMGLLRFAHEWLLEGKNQAQLEAYAQKLYGDYAVADNFTPGKAPTDPNQSIFEAEVAGFLVGMHDPAVRKAAADGARRALGLNGGQPDPAAVAPDFMPLALAVAVQDIGKPAFDALETLFRTTQNPAMRSIALGTMSAAIDPALAERVRALAFDPALKRNESVTIIFGQLSQPETRDATWAWFQQNFDKLLTVIPPDYARRVGAIAGQFCSTERADEVEAFIRPQLDKLPGAELSLDQGLERARLCAARRAAQRPSAEQRFAAP